MHRILSAALLVFAPLSAQASHAVALPQGEEYAALEAEYVQAYSAWEVAYEEARDAGLRGRDRPDEPAIAFWPRYLQAFEGGTGPAGLWLIEHLRDAGLGMRERRDVLPAIVARAYTAEGLAGPWLEEFCLELPRRKSDLDVGALLEALGPWLQRELEPEVRAAGLWLEAEALGWDQKKSGKHAEAIAAALNAALEVAPQSAGGRMAGSELFSVVAEEFRAAQVPGAEEDPAQPLDMSAWRARFEVLAGAGVEEAEVWLEGTAWVAEPEADYDRLLEIELEAEALWLERVAVVEAEDEGDGGPLPPRRLMALYDQPPERAFWPAFEALADADPRAGAWLIKNSSQIPDRSQASRDRLFERLEGLVRDHGDAEWAADLAQGLGRGVPKLLGEERMEELRARWADVSENEEVEVQLRYQLALVEIERDQERAVALLRELTTRWPEHELSDRALGRIASLTQLAIGQVAPEIIAGDLDGVEFKLSDYRGKVVMLDFWGDW